MIEVLDTGATKIEKVNAILSSFGNGSAAFQAVGAAMKRAADSAKTQAGKYASDNYNITKSGFTSHVRITNDMKGGSAGVTSVELSFYGSVIRLMEFHPRFASGGGVSVSVKKGGGGSIHKAFIPTMRSGMGVYERVGKARLPIAQKYGPSTAHMMQNENVVEAMSQHIEEVFEDRIEHEINRILSNYT